MFRRRAALALASCLAFAACSDGSGCVQIVLTTHSFQAPGFYERMGYKKMYTLEGRPQDHAQLIYSKHLRAGDPD